jgi:hypothetical protein
MAKLDGTNGLIQQYDYQVLTTAFSYTFAAGTQTLIINPAGTLATGTVTMPAAPADGMVITVESTQIITALTLSGNTGQSVVGAPARLFPNQPESFVYRASNTTWYPYSIGRSAVLQVVQGTNNTYLSTTSGAYITTGLTASITPSSASSKILVLANLGSMFNSAGGNQLSAAIFRGATNLNAAGAAFGGQFYSTATTETTMSLMILDSPATTSSTAYTVYFASVAGTVNFNQNGGNSYIILQEIAG